jgi:hypothetical protein
MRIILANQFKNESLRIVEWLEYHRDQGIHDFILVDDHSTDDSVEKIKSVTGIRATVLPSELPPLEFMNSQDTEAYRGNERLAKVIVLNFNKVFQYVKAHYDHNTALGFIDFDEFLFSDASQQSVASLIAENIQPYAVMSVSSFEVDSRKFHVTSGPVLQQTTRSMSVKSRALSTRNFVVKSFINFASPNLKYAYSSNQNEFWSQVHLSGMPLKTKKARSSVFLKNFKNRLGHYLFGRKREFTVLDADFVPLHEGDRFAIPNIYLRLEPKALKFLHYRIPTYDLDQNQHLLDQDYQLVK